MIEMDGATRETLTDSHGRLVVRKTATDPVGRARLDHEALMLAAARHPSVAEVLRFAHEEGAATLDVRWIGPSPLNDVPATDAVRAAALVSALAGTVADLHDRGIVHGRIDASHVVLTPDDAPVLCGFGHAVTDGDGDPAADVAGLGSLLHALLAGPEEIEPIPDRRWPRRSEWHGYQRRALLTLADQATLDDPKRRPTARSFAASVEAAVPSPAEALRPGTVGPLDLDREAPAPSDLPPILPVGPRAESARPVRAQRAGRARTAARIPPAAPITHDAVALLEPADPLRRPVPSRARHRPTRPTRRVPLPVGAAFAAVAVLLILGFHVMASRAPADPLESWTARAAITNRARSTTRPRCPRIVGAQVRLPGQQCAALVGLHGRTVTIGASRFSIGRPGDQVAVGRWQCHAATVALVRPATGEVFVFDGWAPQGHAASARNVATVDGATAAVVVTDRRSSCARLFVRRARGPAVEVDTTRGAS